MKYKITRTYIVEAEDPIAARVEFSEAVQNGTEDTYFEGVFIREVSGVKLERKTKEWRVWQREVRRQLFGKANK